MNGRNKAKALVPGCRVAVEVSNQLLTVQRGRSLASLARSGGRSDYHLRQFARGTPRGIRALGTVTSCLGSPSWETAELAACVVEALNRGRVAIKDYESRVIDPIQAIRAVPPLADIVSVLNAKAMGLAAGDRAPDGGNWRRKFVSRVRHGHLPRADSMRWFAEETKASLREKAQLWLAYVLAAAPACLDPDHLDPATYDPQTCPGLHALLACANSKPRPLEPESNTKGENRCGEGHGTN